MKKGHALRVRRHFFGRFGITAFALSGLDIALWDLGRAKRERVDCYVSLLRYTQPKLTAQY